MKSIMGTIAYISGSYYFGPMEFFVGSVCFTAFASALVSQSRANQAHHTLGIRSGIQFAILNQLFPSIQEAINVERVVTSIVNAKLRENGKLKEVFGEIERVEGPTMVFAVRAVDKEVVKVEYKIIGEEKFAVVRMFVEFQGMGFAESIANSKDIAGIIDLIPHKLKIRNMVLKMDEKHKTVFVDLEIERAQLNPKQVVVDGDL
jgi:hypothetical protein